MATPLPRPHDKVIEDLCPCPAPCPVQDQFQLLQTMLSELGLPPTRDRREQPRSGDENDITIVLLSEVKEAVSIFFEGLSFHVRLAVNLVVITGRKTM